MNILPRRGKLNDPKYRSLNRAAKQRSKASSRDRLGLEPIQKILDRWMRKNRVPKRLDKNAIFTRWHEVVGGAIAKHTRVADAQAGVLHVEVNSAPLLHELSTYYRQEILESIKEVEEFSSIRELRFRAGSF